MFKGELELEAELEELMSILAESDLESETGGIVGWVQTVGQRFREGSMVADLIAQGIRDENKLTDEVFFARHPEWRGKSLSNAQVALRREWIEIRDSIVRPVLQNPPVVQPPAPAAPAAPPAAPAPPGAAAILAFNIPESPYSPEAFKKLEQGLSVFDAIHTTVDVFGPELWGLAPGIFEAAGPIAVFVGFWVQMGNAYLEAQAEIVKQASRRAFGLGVVTGADPRKWEFARELFWQWDQNYHIDAYAGDGAAHKQWAAYNTGLLTGWRQGNEVAKNPKKHKFFWDSIISTLPDSDLPKFDLDSVLADFNRGEALAGMRYFEARKLLTDWYITAAVRFDQLYLKD
jgi:hypothetical protein